MSGRIPESFIESLLAKTDIVTVIQETVKLKKTGANYSACCPFHAEKTPSFTVSAPKQFYHCFGCGAHGDAIRFIMENEQLPFPEAVERLATRAGMTVPKDPGEAERVKAKLSLTTVLNQAAEFYAKQLKHHPRAKPAVAYLKKRGLTGAVAKAFGIGFAPPGWENLLGHFGKDPQILKLLEETGLVIRNPQKGSFYDRFRDRVMFPIRDRKGDVIAFGARVLDNSQPKYLNSPESPVFHKGYCLYGLHELLKEKGKRDMAVVVEGYMDVIALSQFGISGAVATLGTAVTAQHLSLLFQHVSEVVFCFDGDKAGQGAAWKALQLVLPLLTEERKIGFAFVPQGEDPDSYARREGADALRALIRNCTPLSEYFFATMTQKIPLNSVDNRARFASKAKPFLEEIPAGIFKEMMYEKLAQTVESSPEVVRGRKTFRPYFPKPRAKKDPAPAPMELLYMASALLLRDPALNRAVTDKAAFWHDISMPGMELFRTCFALSMEGSSTGLILEKLQKSGFDLQRLEECGKKVALIPDDGITAEFGGIIAKLGGIGREQFAQKLIEKAKKAELSEEEKNQLKEILQFRESNG